MTNGETPLLRLLGRAMFASAIVVAASVVLIAVAASREDGFTKALLMSLGSAGFSIGGIGLLYEVYLRRTQTHDVLRLVRLEKNLADVGIRSIVKKPKVAWGDFFAGARVIRLIPADPIAWVNDEWPKVLEANLNRSVQTEVYLPRPDGPELDLFSFRLGRDVEPFRTELGDILARVEREWVAYARGRRASARLRIYTYDAVPTVGVAHADDRYVIMIPGVFDTGAAQETLAFRFEADTDSLIGNWVADELASLEAVGRHYETPQADGHQT